MVNNKLLGLLLMAFIAAIVALAIIPSIAVTTSVLSNTFTIENETITAPDYLGTIDLTGQEIIDSPTPTVYNATNITLFTQVTNYTITEAISSTTGLKTIIFTTLNGSDFANESVNVSYTYGADGYIDNSAGRNLTGLIIIFLAIGIIVTILGMVFKSDLMKIVGR